MTTVTVGSTQTLPAGASVIASNPGLVMAFCQLGATASVNSQPIAPSGGWFDFTVGSATQIHLRHGDLDNGPVNTFGGAGIGTGTGGGGGGSGGGNVTIVGPLGTQASSGAVAVTPATSTFWGGPLGVRRQLAILRLSTPATSSVWGGPLGTQAISNSQAVNPATGTNWPVTTTALRPMW